MTSQDMKSLIGKTYVDDQHELVDDTAQDGRQSDKETVVRHSELPEGTRVIKPNTIITMDFRADRWNLHVDEGNKVTKVIKG